MISKLSLFFFSDLNKKRGDGITLVKSHPNFPSAPYIAPTILWSPCPLVKGRSLARHQTGTFPKSWLGLSAPNLLGQ